MGNGVHPRASCIPTDTICLSDTRNIFVYGCNCSHNISDEVDVECQTALKLFGSKQKIWQTETQQSSQLLVTLAHRRHNSQIN